MMFKLTCNFCGKNYSFSLVDEKPEICENCGTFVKDIDFTEQSDDHQENKSDDFNESKSILTLTYQKTGKRIEIINPNFPVVLGREAEGSSLLKSIPQISRTHCSLNIQENEIVVTDLGSKNGTFVSIDKISCKENPNQIIRDGELLFFGREPFQVEFKLNPTEPALGKEAEKEKSDNPPISSVYRCNVCGEVFNEFLEICPNDNTFGSIIKIENHNTTLEEGSLGAN